MISSLRSFPGPRRLPHPCPEGWCRGQLQLSWTDQQRATHANTPVSPDPKLWKCGRFQPTEVGCLKKRSHFNQDLNRSTIFLVLSSPCKNSVLKMDELWPSRVALCLTSLTFHDVPSRPPSRSLHPIRMTQTWSSTGLVNNSILICCLFTIKDGWVRFYLPPIQTVCSVWTPH